MWSEAAKQEWKDMAASAKVREEFLLLERLGRNEQARMSLDDYLKFLSVMSRLCPAAPQRPIERISGTNFKL